MSLAWIVVIVIILLVGFAMFQTGGGLGILLAAIVGFGAFLVTILWLGRDH